MVRKSAAVQEVLNMPVEGSEFIKPISEWGVREQSDMYASCLPFIKAIQDDTSESESIPAEALALIPDVVDCLEKYIVDKEGFDKFSSGPGAMGRTLTLVMWVLSELGG